MRRHAAPILPAYAPGAYNVPTFYPRHHRLLSGLFALGGAAFAVALGAAGAGCGACTSRPRGSGLFVEIPAAVLDSAPGAPLTLKLRVRALDLEGPFAPGGDFSPVLNLLTEQPVTPCGEPGCGLTGRDGLSFLLSPMTSALPGENPWLDARVVVHVTLFANSAEEVRDAFAALDDPTLGRVPCGTLDCAHLPLATLNAIGAYSITLEHLGRTDADIVLYPLALDGLDVDGDADTIPGLRAFADGSTTECVPFLADPQAPWNDQRIGACESIADADHADCDDNRIATNPFELEVGPDFSFRCLDLMDQNCDGADDPCPDGDGDGIPLPDDCNDEDASVHPGATELCQDDVDQDCDGADQLCACDLDGDAFCPTPFEGAAGGDCCETGAEPECGGAAPASINPAAQEVCGNGRDENCDAVDPPCLSPDADGDGHCAVEYQCAIDCATADPLGAPLCCILRLSLDPAALAGCVFDDCDDTDADRFPGHGEACNDGVDQDCDGADAGCAADDGDFDGWGVSAGDCDDSSASVSPGAGEVCGNGIDDDCAGGDLPCDALVDADGDTYVACVPPDKTGCDCDDTDPAVHPFAPELCNADDDDCDGVVNEGNPIGAADPDCWGNPPESAPPFFVPAGAGETWRCRSGRTACSPSGSLVCTGVIPPVVGGATSCTDDPLCNGRNDVCVMCADGGLIPDGERDADGDGCIVCDAPAIDGVTATVGDLCAGPDCNDADPAVYPGAHETCLDVSVNNDCDANLMELCDAGVPMPPEICDGNDQDCDCQDDLTDPDAQSQCPAGEYCNGMSCQVGCNEDPDCTNGNTCDTNSLSPTYHQCLCGVGAGCIGSYTCSGGLCLCGGAACGFLETCTMAGGDCACGGTTAPTGEACPNSSAAPDCTAMGCRCETSACGAGETCTGPNGDCACGAITAPVGEACPGAANPNCGGGACRCDGDSSCDPDETCNGASTACTCGATAPANGPACPSSNLANPTCVSGSACGCDSNSTCDSDETCNTGTGSCTCGGSAPSGGAACPAGSPNPLCTGGGCACDATGTSVCDVDETCVGGNCVCGAAAPLTGQACPDADANPHCVSGSCACDSDSTCNPGETCGVSGHCTCGAASPASGPACPPPTLCASGSCVTPNCTNPLFPCLMGWVCNMTSGECECNGDSDCRIGGSTVAKCRSGLCDCDGGSDNPACAAGEDCFGDSLMNCECMQATCF